MEDNFKIEIISPEKIVFADNIKMATLPSYEGDMSILKNHISIITFLRPGIIRVEKKEENSQNFFVEDGTVEYFNDNLIILSSSATNVKNLSKESIKSLNKEIEEKLVDKNITDHDRYVLNYKLDTIKELEL
jgi:F-type H+-transporting ATPase subunit epsilon